MKIPFFYKYDPTIELIEDINERKCAIKDKIRECNDTNHDIFVQTLIFLIFSIISFCIMSVIAFVSKKDIGNITHISLGVAFFIWFLFTLYNNNLKQKYKRLLLKIDDYKKEEIKEIVDEDIFENAIKLSYKYLDEYYSQTRKQAQKGFYITISIAVAGFGLIVAGVIMMFMEKIQMASVTCASGVITEFISSIFFYLYNKTVNSMSAYHNKLVLSHNISIALKVAESLPEEDKVKSKNLIIEELLKNINSYLIIPDNDVDDKK